MVTDGHTENPRHLHQGERHCASTSSWSPHSFPPCPLPLSWELLPPQPLRSSTLPPPNLSHHFCSPHPPPVPLLLRWGAAVQGRLVILPPQSPAAASPLLLLLPPWSARDLRFRPLAGCAFPRVKAVR